MQRYGVFADGELVSTYRRRGEAILVAEELGVEFPELTIEVDELSDWEDE